MSSSFSSKAEVFVTTFRFAPLVRTVEEGVHSFLSR